MEYFDIHRPEPQGGGIMIGRTKRKKVGSGSSLKQVTKGESTKGGSSSYQTHNPSRGSSTLTLPSSHLSSSSSSSQPSSSKRPLSPMGPKSVVQARLHSDSGARTDSRKQKNTSGRGDDGSSLKFKKKDRSGEEELEFPLSSASQELRRLNRIEGSENDQIGYKPKNRLKKIERGRGKDIREGGYDTPDPLELSESSVDIGKKIDSKLDKARKKVQKVLVPPTPGNTLSNVKERKGIRGRETRSTTASSSDISTSSSDSEPTPRPRPSKEVGAKARKELDRVKNEEKEDSGDVFFREFESLNEQEMEAKFGPSQSSTVVVEEPEIGSSPLSTSMMESLDLDVPVEAHSPRQVMMTNANLTLEEREYVKNFIDMDDICKYCNLPMPRELSARLSSLQCQLRQVEDELQRLDQEIPWTRTVEFCALHTAETIVIPLGYRAGYPKEIKFGDIPDRLEMDWIRSEMEEIMIDPEVSPYFRKILSDIEKRGKYKWSGMGNQAREEVINPSMPGYYGQLGRAIILRHYEHLLQWNLLPRLSYKEGKTAIAPLTTTEFISHVLVPEASIRLIMSDKGWKGDQDAQSQAYTRARSEAFTIRADSIDFGRGRYSADGEEAREILEAMEGREEEIRRVCKARRTLSVGNVEEKEKQIPVEEKQFPVEEEDEELVILVDISSDESDQDSGTPKKKRKTEKVRSTRSRSTSRTLCIDQDEGNDIEYEDNDEYYDNDDKLYKDTPNPRGKSVKGSKQNSVIEIFSSPTISPTCLPRMTTLDKESSGSRRIFRTSSFTRTDSEKTESSFGLGNDHDFDVAFENLGKEYD